MDEDKKYWVAFSTFPSIGIKKFKVLLNKFGSAKTAWQASSNDLQLLGFSENFIKKFINHREQINLNDYLEKIEKLGINILTFDSPKYPANLKKIDDSPFVFYLMGELKEEDELAIGVVGTRKISNYGRQVTENLVSDLVLNGVTIVSGLAYGVDFVAHETALDGGGRTIGVWAGGIETVFEGFRKNLVEKMIKSGKGIVISEFPLGFHPTLSSFPQRNRIISGLSLGVLVTEATQDSGSLITAEFAKKQNKIVFSVPGPITSSLSSGTSQLLKEGAQLVTGGKDILDKLNLYDKGKKIEARKVIKGNKEELVIMELVEKENMSLDEICREIGKPASEIASLLTLMELKGMVKKVGNGEYQLTREIQ